MLAPYTRRNHSFWDPFAHWPEWQSFFPENGAELFPTDIREEGDRFVLEAELPGYRKEDITVELGGSTLTITAKRQAEQEQQGRVLRRERFCGACSRSFDTAGIDTERIEAAYENGILRLTLPKQQEQVAGTRKLELH